MNVLIAVATYNRPVITDLCLHNLAGFKAADTRLVVYDDASTAYDAAWLASFADEVVRFDANRGISHSRARAVRDFVDRFTDFDLLYLTDNDTIHDPGAMAALRAAAAIVGGAGMTRAISLFQSVFHTAADNILGTHPDLLLVKSIPGASVCYDRAIAQRLVAALDANPELETLPGWDWNYMAVLNQPSVTTRVSYMEHFARDRHEGGLHNDASGLGDAGLPDFERDRAVNPTAWLADERPRIIRTLIY